MAFGIKYLQEHDNLRRYACVILENHLHLIAVKRGYVDEAAHWRYSSARDYEGHKGQIRICRAW